MCDRIEQCSSCNAALTEGYVEMNDPLTDIRSRICFDCGIKNLLIQRALHADDLLAAGMMEDAEVHLDNGGER